MKGSNIYLYGVYGWSFGPGPDGCFLFRGMDGLGKFVSCFQGESRLGVCCERCVGEDGERDRGGQWERKGRKWERNL